MWQQNVVYFVCAARKNFPLQDYKSAVSDYISDYLRGAEEVVINELL